jgi:hypothetical protein
MNVVVIIILFVNEIVVRIKIIVEIVLSLIMEFVLREKRLLQNLPVHQIYVEIDSLMVVKHVIQAEI